MTSSKSKRPNRALFLRIFGTLLAVGLLLYLLSQQGWHEIGTALRSLSAWRIGAMVALMLISRLAVAARWHVLLRGAGLKISPGQSLSLTFAGLFANNFLPTTIGGDLIRLAGALLLKFDAAICTASLVADRLVGMAGMVMTLPFGILRWAPHWRDASTRHGGWDWLVLGVGLPKWRESISNAWAKAWKLARQLLETLALWLKQPGTLLLALAFSWVHMVCVFAILGLFFDGMQDHIPFWVVAGLYSMVYFVTLLPISVNGYGVQELSMTVIFSSLGGATLANGITAALVFRTLLMLASLPGALFVPGIMAGRKAQQSGEGPGA